MKRTLETGLPSMECPDLRKRCGAPQRPAGPVKHDGDIYAKDANDGERRAWTTP